MDSFLNFTVSLLLAYKCNWFLYFFYPATLLNSFSVLVVSWWNLWGTISCYLQLKTVLLLPFQFGYLLFLLLVWLLWLGPPHIEKEGWKQTFLSCSRSKGNTCSFCPLNMMLVVGLSYMAFIMFRYVPSIPTLLWVFIINRCWTLSNAFLHLLIWSCGFYSSFCSCGESYLLVCECCTNITFLK